MRQMPDDQYIALYNAPFAAATYVSLASGGMMDFAKEMFAAGRFITEGTRPGVYGVLVDALLAEYANGSPEEAKRLELHYTGDNLSSLRAQARQVVVEAAGAVRGLPGAEGYRQWLMDAARTAAMAAAGNIFGGGRGEVDVHEQAAIEELAAILLIERNPPRETRSRPP
jgi:hypothetical protein